MLISSSVGNLLKRRRPILREDRSLGFRAWSGTPPRMPAPHVHTDVECNLVLRGSMRNFLSGAYHDTRAGGVAVFWGGVPHWLVDAPPQTRVIWLTIPLTWLIQWELDGPFLQRLLRGEMLGRP